MKSKMRTRKQIEFSLQYAREQFAIADAAEDAAAYKSAAYENARVDRLIWIGHVQALLSVLNIEERFPASKEATK
jgi:hypothetical protein